MKKSDLDTGMLFEKDDRLFIVLRCEGGRDKYIQKPRENGTSIHGYMDVLNMDRVKAVYKPRYSHKMLSFELQYYEKIWEPEDSIDISIKINGKKANLSDISEKTLLKLRQEN